MNIVFFIRETINGENPASSSEIESTQDVKPQNSKMHSDSSHLLLLKPQCLSFLNYVLHLSV